MPKRQFQNIAKLVRTKRMSHPKGYSQAELSKILGYKNGQFISNVERSLCSIPLKMLPKICQILDISKEDVKSAVMRDFEGTVDTYLTMAPTATVNNVKSLQERREEVQSSVVQLPQNDNKDKQAA